MAGAIWNGGCWNRRKAELSYCKPEVPENEWFKRFPDMTVCGEGELVGQRPKTSGYPIRWHLESRMVLATSKKRWKIRGQSILELFSLLGCAEMKNQVAILCEKLLRCSDDGLLVAGFEGKSFHHCSDFSVFRVD